jgi:hypothetical protein
MNMLRFAKQEVEVDGIVYEVGGFFNPEGGVYGIHIYGKGSDVDITEHLKDGVVEDIMDALWERFSFSTGSDELWTDPNWEDIEVESSR